MPRKRLASRLHLLSVREVQTAADGNHSDGGGLLLCVREQLATWVFRYTSASGKRREMGLGIAHRNNPQVAASSLTVAREQAQKARSQLSNGVDPIDMRNELRRTAKAEEQAKKTEARRDHLTLARVARDYQERVIEPTRTNKHSAQWISSLENHVPDRLWHKPIVEITAPELLDFIAELQAKIPETASRVRQRLETIFDDAEFRRVSTGNPARAIRRKLRETKKGCRRGAFAALPYAKVPQFVKILREREAIAARALEFALLTAARTGEVIGATWDEFDLDSRLWTVPAGRMKGGEKHVVYLSPRAIEIVEAMRELKQPYVFPAPTLNGTSLSNMAMLTLLRRMDADKKTTVHGLCRACLSTWAYETGAARPEVIEATLAHREADKVKAAYMRADFARDRAALLLSWADFIDGKSPASNVIDFQRPRAA
jgi:integrase